MGEGKDFLQKTQPFYYRGGKLTNWVIQIYKINSSVINTKLIIFLNLRAFFSDEQIEEVYKTANYNKIYIFLLETQKRNSIDGEKYCIIDSDKCLIKQ